MPPLNDDVLNEIFQKLIDDTWVDSQTLERFMLAGREPYEIALKNFAQASSIEIWEDELVITADFKVRWFKVLNCDIFGLFFKHSIHIYFDLTYTSPILKPIFDVASSVVHAFYVRDWPTQHFDVDFSKLFGESEFLSLSLLGGQTSQKIEIFHN